MFIVGYASNDTREGATIITAQFVGVGTTSELELQSIKCSEGSSDMIVLSTLDEIGMMIDSYFWVDYGGETGDEECWLDGKTMEKAEGVTFQPGQGLWVESYDASCKLITSGQVSISDIEVELCVGATMTGNPTPIAIDLQDIMAASESSDLIVLSTLDEIGMMIDSYFWVNYGGESGEEECWLDGKTMEKAEGVTIEAGQGLWAEAFEDKISVTFPGVELK